MQLPGPAVGGLKVAGKSPARPKLDGAFDFEIEELAAAVGDLLQQRQGRIITAESCTGGWISAALTAVPGSSQWFALGLTTYSNEAKQQLLQVDKALLKRHSAVSKQTVQAMAKGALQLDPGAMLAVAVSGIAGPDSSGRLEVGSVHIAWMLRGSAARESAFVFGGSRNEVRRASVIAALKGCIQTLVGDSRQSGSP